MPTLQGLAEHFRSTVDTSLFMLNAIDQVMSVLPLEALIEGKGLQASETH